MVFLFFPAGYTGARVSARICFFFLLFFWDECLNEVVFQRTYRFVADQTAARETCGCKLGIVVRGYKRKPPGPSGYPSAGIQTRIRGEKSRANMI